MFTFEDRLEGVETGTASSESGMPDRRREGERQREINDGTNSSQIGPQRFDQAMKKKNGSCFVQRH